MALSCVKKKLLGGPPIPSLYTRPPSKSFKLAETHHFYVKDPKSLPKSVPPPRPPDTQKSDIFDITKHSLVDDKAIRVPLTVLSKPIPTLVDYLIEDYEDDLSKVRVLFRWLTNQPIHRMQVLENAPKNKHSALFHLYLLRTQKQRYSKMFSTLCRYSGLYNVIVHGAVKGVHYKIGEEVDMVRHYGEWNAVLIDGDWRLVDTLWGACDVRDPGDGRGRFQCDERFFLTDPKDLLYTHFAETPQWQLVDVPRQIEVFQESACLKSRFFDFEMQILSHPACEIKCPDGEVDFMFSVKHKKAQDQKFACYISRFDKEETRQTLTKGSSKSVPIFIHKPTESSVSFRVRFPDSGVFRVEIVGKDIAKQNPFKQYNWIAVYKVEVEEPAPRGFPVMDPIGWGPGKEITKIGLAPFNYTSGIIVAKNVQTKLRFKIIETHLVQNMKFFFKITSTHGNDVAMKAVSDKFEIDLNIMTFFIEAPPFGEYTLKMFARNVRGNTTVGYRGEINICNYLLISDIQQQGSPLEILTERSEIVKDEQPVTKLYERVNRSVSPTFSRPKSEKDSNREAEIAESIVSASNVQVDSKPQQAEGDRKSPVLVKMKQTTADTSGGAIIVKPSAKPGIERPFVRNDSDFQEIPEIPLEVVKPVVKGADPVTEKREMKVVSTNRVVPLHVSGGNDDSIMLVPTENKPPKRPATGFKRSQSSQDQAQYFTAMAHVKPA